MTSTPAAVARLRFGRFELQSDQRRLLCDGEPVVLGGRAFDLLEALASRPGQLVGKAALMDLVWPGLVVEDNNLAAQVSALRRVVGAEVVATVPGRGYRFTAPVDAAVAAEPPDPPRQAPRPAALPTNLPGELPSLVGREADLAALAAAVDAARLVSLVGAGGIGKSLLAQHLLQSRRGAYPQGVCFVELAAVHDAAALPGAVAAALGVHGGPGEPRAELLHAVAPLSLLLALDNAEHLADAVAALCPSLLAAAPGVRLLVTSQAPLKLPNERLLRLAPLAVPEQPLPAAQAAAFGAVALFVERARGVDPRFALSDANVPAVVEVCRALDGLPLAIELAAARAPLLGLERLLASMHERLQLLTASRNRAAPERQQTLRATLEWSHALLTAAEQRVFRRLAVVAGSATLELVQALVVDDDGSEGEDRLDGWSVLDALDALVERSLVALLAGDDRRAAPRYRLLESPRTLALERLALSGEEPLLRRRHAAAMAAAFDAAHDTYFAGACGVDRWLLQMAADLDNAREAWAHARDAGERRQQLVLGATLLRALPPSLHAERMALADACAAALEPAADLPAPLRLRLTLELSCVWADTQKARSRDAALQALALARGLDGAAGDRFALYHALCRVASAAAQAGDLAAAAAPLAELQRIEDPAWPPHRLLWGTEAAQVVARFGGDTAAALRLSHRLLALDRDRGGDASIAYGNLVDAELAAGDARGAAASGAELVAALEGTRHEYTLAYARLNLCAAWLALDASAEARTVALAAWPQALAFELHHYAAVYLSLLAALEQRPHAAARLVGHAEAAYAAREEAIETNEAAALARARALATAAIGAAAFDRARAEGAAVPADALAALAFAGADAR